MQAPVEQEHGVCSECGAEARRLKNGGGWFHCGPPCRERNAPKGKFPVVPTFVMKSRSRVSKRTSSVAEQLRAQVARLQRELQSQAGRHGAAMQALRDENTDLRRLAAALEERLRAYAGPAPGASGIESLMRERPSANPRRPD